MASRKKEGSSPLQYAIDSKTGTLVFIKHVQPNHTHLICPSENCSCPVHAVLGYKNKIDFFRHNPTSSSSDRECRDPTGAQESIVHQLAKQVFLKRKNMYLFPYVIGFERYRGKGIKPLRIGRYPEGGEKVYFSNIEDELRRISSDYQPDITAELDGEEFIIEIHYKHLVDEKKLDKILRDDIPAVEISLSHLSHQIDKYEIDRAFTNPKYFKWLHFPERWLTDNERTRVSEYLENEHKRIDEEIENDKRQSLLREQAEIERREAYERGQIISRARQNEPYFAEHIREYFQQLLKECEISPFSREAQQELKDCFGHIKRANEIITQKSESLNDLFSKVPSVNDYRRIIESIGNGYRRKLAGEIYTSISNWDEWSLEHINELTNLGWDFRSQVRRFVNYASSSFKYSDDDLLAEAGLYIQNKILPQCKTIVTSYIGEHGLAQ